MESTLKFVLHQDPSMEPAPSLFLKVHLILLCPQRVPNKPKYFLLLFEKLLLQSRGTACVGCIWVPDLKLQSCRRWAQGTFSLHKSRNIEVHCCGNLAPCSVFGIRLGRGWAVWDRRSCLCLGKS